MRDLALTLTVPLHIMRPDKYNGATENLRIAVNYGGSSWHRLLASPAAKPYSNAMSPLRAHVEKGRLLLDEPTTLPDGTVVELVVDDHGDDVSDDERRALHQTLSASWKSAEEGQLRPASEILNRVAPAPVILLVRTTPEADAHASEIDSWWRNNRQASPELFLEELTQAFDILRHR